MKFRGTVVLPLDRQNDRDGYRIDPTGVTLPEGEVPIFQDFSYRVPEDVVGSGTLSRAEDGSIVMEGHLDTGSGMKLAIGVTVEDISDAMKVITKSNYIATGRCAAHKDPDQPDIEVES